MEASQPPSREPRGYSVDFEMETCHLSRCGGAGEGWEELEGAEGEGIGGQIERQKQRRMSEREGKEGDR